MSETNTKAKPSDTDLLLTAVDTIQQVQEEHGIILTHLESRPIVDLKGIERRLEEVADAIHTTPQALPTQRRRPWWLTPVLMTLAFVLGAASIYGVLVWQAQQARVEGKQPPAATMPGKAPTAKRGR